MHHRTNGRRGLFPRPSTTTYFDLRRPNLTTTVKSQPKICGHHRPIFRNVVAPGGSASYLCRTCFAHVRAIEVRAIEVDRVRRELASLFRNSWPPGSLLGAVAAAAIGKEATR